MSAPLGWDRRDDPGLRGAAARWWGRRRTRRVAAALDEAKQAAEERAAGERARPGGTDDGGTPNGIRTRATAVKGRGPGPLDDGGPTARRTDPSSDGSSLGEDDAPAVRGQA